MATCNYNVGFNADVCGMFGTWFRCPSAPAADTAVAEVYSVGNGYQLIVLRSIGTLEWWYSWVGYWGTVASFNSATVVPTNTWMWVSGSFNRNGTGHIHAVAEAWTATSTFGPQISAENLSTVGSGPSPTWAASFNLGRSQAYPALAQFPNGMPGWEFSKAIIKGNVGTGVIGPPSVDWGTTISAGWGGFYNMRSTQPLGAISSLHDDSGNGFDMGAGSGGAGLVLPGPFAS